MINYLCWIFMRWYFFTYIAFLNYFIIDTNTWLYISFFCKVMSVLNELLVWALIRGRFEFPVTFSLLDIFKLFDLLLLTCELTVVHPLFLEMYEIFLLFFLPDKVNKINIFYFWKKILSRYIRNKTWGLRRRSMS